MDRLPTPVKTVATLIVVAVAATIWLSSAAVAPPSTQEFALEEVTAGVSF